MYQSVCADMWAGMIDVAKDMGLQHLRILPGMKHRHCSGHTDCKSDACEPQSLRLSATPASCRTVIFGDCCFVAILGAFLVAYVVIGRPVLLCALRSAFVRDMAAIASFLASVGIIWHCWVSLCGFVIKSCCRFDTPSRRREKLAAALAALDAAFPPTTGGAWGDHREVFVKGLDVGCACVFCVGVHVCECRLAKRSTCVHVG